MVKVLESACGTKYINTEFIATFVSTASTTISTSGTASASATSNLSAFNVREVVNFMTKKLIPKYDGRNYVCIAGVTAMSGMHADTAAGGWQDISKYTVTFAPNVFAGEVGEFYKTRFVEETGFLSNTIGNATSYGQAVFFGSDQVYEAMAVPEEIRVKIPLDFGRDMGLAWYALLGFQTVWNYAVDTEQHIVFVTSQ